MKIINVILIGIGVVFVILTGIILNFAIEEQMLRDECFSNLVSTHCENNDMTPHLIFNKYRFQCLNQEERTNHQEGIYDFYFTDKEKEVCLNITINKFSGRGEN